MRGRHAGGIHQQAGQHRAAWGGLVKGTDADSPRTGRSAPTSVPPHVVGTHIRTARAYREGGKWVQAVHGLLKPGPT